MSHKRNTVCAEVALLVAILGLWLTSLHVWCVATAVCEPMIATGECVNLEPDCELACKLVIPTG